MENPIQEPASILVNLAAKWTHIKELIRIRFIKITADLYLSRFTIQICNAILESGNGLTISKMMRKEKPLNKEFPN